MEDTACQLTGRPAFPLLAFLYSISSPCLGMVPPTPDNQQWLLTEMPTGQYDLGSLSNEMPFSDDSGLCQVDSHN